MSTCELQSNSNHIAKRFNWIGVLEFEKTIFVLVNLMDIVMTFLLLNTGSFYESNPIADQVLQNWGMPGMITFKLVTVLFVLSIANILAFKRMEVARRLLYAGTFIVGTVVTYSVCCLFLA